MAGRPSPILRTSASSESTTPKRKLSFSMDSGDTLWESPEKIDDLFKAKVSCLGAEGAMQWAMALSKACSEAASRERARANAGRQHAMQALPPCPTAVKEEVEDKPQLRRLKPIVTAEALPVPTTPKSRSCGLDNALTVKRERDAEERPARKSRERNDEEEDEGERREKAPKKKKEDPPPPKVSNSLCKREADEDEEQEKAPKKKSRSPPQGKPEGLRGGT